MKFILLHRKSREHTRESSNEITTQSARINKKLATKIAQISSARAADAQITDHHAGRKRSCIQLTRMRYFAGNVNSEDGRRRVRQIGTKSGLVTSHPVTSSYLLTMPMLKKYGKESRVCPSRAFLRNLNHP